MDGEQDAGGDAGPRAGATAGFRTRAAGEPAPTPTPSSTIMIVRDGDRGVEVFMLERHIRADFAGGALVFPGGKVERADRSLPADRWSGAEPDALAALLECPPEDALGLYVAAVRETFEEAGVLLARRGGRLLTSDELRTPAMRAARDALNDRERAFDLSAWLAEQDLVLDLGAIAYWSWWVTPEMSPKRYDTRFFVARIPDEQHDVLAHDDVETTDSRWTTPEDALAAHAEGRATVIYPTRKNLEALAGYATATEVVDAAAQGRTDRRRLVPEIVLVDGEPRIRHPDGGPLEAP